MNKIELDLNGGRIKELFLKGEKILGTYRRIDGKVSNTHVCTPNFGDELREWGLPFHGLARNEKWDLIKKTNKFWEIRYKMEERELYPTNLEIKQIFETGDTFNHVVQVKNIGSQEALANIAIHYYFDMPNGWKKLLINDINVSDYIAADSEIKAGVLNKISDGNRLLMMKTKNVSGLHLWSGGNKDFCCIEPVMGLRKLDSGKKLEIEVSISLEQ